MLNTAFLNVHQAQSIHHIYVYTLNNTYLPAKQDTQSSTRYMLNSACKTVHSKQQETLNSRGRSDRVRAVRASTGSIPTLERDAPVKLLMEPLFSRSVGALDARHGGRAPHYSFMKSFFSACLPRPGTGYQGKVVRWTTTYGVI